MDEDTLSQQYADIERLRGDHALTLRAAWQSSRPGDHPGPPENGDSAEVEIYGWDNKLPIFSNPAAHQSYLTASQALRALRPFLQDQEMKSFAGSLTPRDLTLMILTGHIPPKRANLAQWNGDEVLRLRRKDIGPVPWRD